MATFTDGATPGWAAYGSVFVAMLIALALPVVLHIIGKMVGLWPRGSDAAGEAPPRVPDIPPESTVNTRYFSAAQMAGVVGIPLLMLIPLIDSQSPGATVAIVSICVCLGVALVYANRKRDLKWNDTTLSEDELPRAAGRVDS